MVVIQGSLYFEDIELPEVVGCTMDYPDLAKGWHCKTVLKDAKAWGAIPAPKYVGAVPTRCGVLGQVGGSDDT